MREVIELNFQTRTRDALTGGGVLWQPNMAAAPTEAWQLTSNNGVATLWGVIGKNQRATHVS